MDSIRRNFHWSSFGSGFRYLLVKSNIVKLLVPDGGLGVRNLKLFNEAFGRDGVVTR